MLKTPVLRARQGNKWLSQVTYCNANVYTIFINTKHLHVFNYFLELSWLVLRYQYQ